MIINAKTPGAAQMAIIDQDGTDLTKKYHIESFDTDTGDAVIVELVEVNTATALLPQYIPQRRIAKFPNAKIQQKTP